MTNEIPRREHIPGEELPVCRQCKRSGPGDYLETTDGFHFCSGCLALDRDKWKAAAEEGAARVEELDEIALRTDNRLELRLVALKNEVNCRWEHGADGKEHLKYIEGALDEILASMRGENNVE